MNASIINTTVDAIINDITLSSTVRPLHILNVKWSANLIISLVIGAVGIISNSFAIIVLCSDKAMRAKIMNKFLINQSVIDLGGSFFILVNLPSVDGSMLLAGGIIGR